MPRRLRWGRFVPALLCLASLPVVALFATEPRPLAQPGIVAPDTPRQASAQDGGHEAIRSLLDRLVDAEARLERDPAEALRVGLRVWEESASLQGQGGLFHALAGAGVALQSTELVRDALAHPFLERASLEDARPRLQTLARHELDVPALGTREVRSARQALGRHLREAPREAMAYYLHARIAVRDAQAVGAAGWHPVELLTARAGSGQLRRGYVEAALDDRAVRLRAAALYGIAGARLGGGAYACSRTLDGLAPLDTANASWDPDRCALAVADHPERAPFLVVVAPPVR